MQRWYTRHFHLLRFDDDGYGVAVGLGRRSLGEMGDIVLNMLSTPKVTIKRETPNSDVFVVNAPKVSQDSLQQAFRLAPYMSQLNGYELLA